MHEKRRTHISDKNKTDVFCRDVVPPTVKLFKGTLTSAWNVDCPDTSKVPPMVMELLPLNYE